MGRTLAAFVLPLALGRAVEFLLSTSVGNRIAESVNNPTLATLEGRQVVRKYSTAAAAVAVGASFALARRPDGAVGRRRDREETVGLVAETLLSAGALAKVVADFLRDQREVKRRQGIAV
jgi:hypothetical protein